MESQPEADGHARALASNRPRKTITFQLVD